MRFINLKEEKIKFTMNVKKENIQSMTGLEFEGFCKWLFEEEIFQIVSSQSPHCNYYHI